MDKNETKIAQLEAELSQLRTNVIPSVHIVQGTEYERGWGQRPDGYVAFTTEAAAKEFIIDYDARYNNLPTVPDEYTKYAYVGVRQCSFEFMDLLIAAKSGYRHIHNLQELRKVTA